jgi:hypothetical protein
MSKWAARAKAHFSGSRGSSTAKTDETPSMIAEKTHCCTAKTNLSAVLAVRGVWVSEKRMFSESAVNDPAPQPLTITQEDPDRWCWPHSDAMNGAEIDAFTARVHRFTAKGLRPADAEQMADRLVIRDREQDARRVCLECGHCSGSKSWRCGNWKQAAIGTRAADAGLAHGLVVMLQHCPGFREATWAR